MHTTTGATPFSTLSRFEEATAKYKRAIELDPHDLKAYNNCGNALFKLSKFEEATAKYERVIELSPNNADAYYNWGVVLEKQNKRGWLWKSLRWLNL
jgi:tetratricopeptide (TPR) repeat protein